MMSFYHAGGGRPRDATDVAGAGGDGQGTNGQGPTWWKSGDWWTATNGTVVEGTNGGPDPSASSGGGAGGSAVRARSDVWGSAGWSSGPAGGGWESQSTSAQSWYSKAKADPSSWTGGWVASHRRAGSAGASDGGRRSAAPCAPPPAAEPRPPPDEDTVRQALEEVETDRKTPGESPRRREALWCQAVRLCAAAGRHKEALGLLEELEEIEVAHRRLKPDAAAFCAAAEACEDGGHPLERVWSLLSDMNGLLKDARAPDNEKKQPAPDASLRTGTPPVEPHDGAAVAAENDHRGWPLRHGGELAREGLRRHADRWLKDEKCWELFDAMISSMLHENSEQEQPSEMSSDNGARPAECHISTTPATENGNEGGHALGHGGDSKPDKLRQRAQRWLQEWEPTFWNPLRAVVFLASALRRQGALQPEIEARVRTHVVMPVVDALLRAVKAGGPPPPLFACVPSLGPFTNEVLEALDLSGPGDGATEGRWRQAARAELQRQELRRRWAAWDEADPPGGTGQGLTCWFAYDLTVGEGSDSCELCSDGEAFGFVAAPPEAEVAVRDALFGGVATDQAANEAAGHAERRALVALACRLFGHFPAPAADGRDHAALRVEGIVMLYSLRPPSLASVYSMRQFQQFFPCVRLSVGYGVPEEATPLRQIGGTTPSWGCSKRWSGGWQDGSGAASAAGGAAPAGGGGAVAGGSAAGGGAATEDGWTAATKGLDSEGRNGAWSKSVNGSHVAPGWCRVGAGTDLPDAAKAPAQEGGGGADATNGAWDRWL